MNQFIINQLNTYRIKSWLYKSAIGSKEGIMMGFDPNKFKFIEAWEV